MKQSRLFYLLAVITAWFNLQAVSAEGIPYLPMKTDFQGSAVDLATFELPAGDFTLEATCDAGANIIICGGVYEYTSKAAGKVRFAQRKSSMYVYEGNSYQTSLSAAEIMPSPGILNVTSATFLDGTAYAPEMTLGEEDYFDMTAYVTNPNFDTDVAGWTTTTGATSKRGSGTLPGEAIDGPGGYWQNWRGSAFTGKMYQIISGLPSGKYKLKAAAYTEKHPEDLHEWMYLYLNESQTAVTESVSEFYEVEGVTADGTLEIGLNMTEAISTLVGLDNVQLFYYGADLTSLVAILQEQINAAKEYSNQKMNTGVSSELSTAVSEAEAAVANPSEEGINAAAAKLRTTTETAKVSVAAYAELDAAIKAVDANLPTYSTYPGYNAFVEVVNNTKSAYNAATMENEAVKAIIGTMNAAEVTCLLTQPAPFDATFAIVNPGFETNGLGGWVNNGMQRQTNTSFALKDSTAYVEKWISYPGTLDDASISQTITNLPNGVYKVTALAHSVQSTDPTTAAEGGFLFANTATTEVGLDDEYEVEGIVFDNTLTIGFKTEGTTANWVAVDHFRLQYIGFNQSVAIAALEALVDKAYNSMLDDYTVQKSVETELYDAISEAQDVISNPTDEQIEESSIRLTAAINAVEKSIASYEELVEIIIEYDVILNNTAGYPGHETFRDVYNEARKAYGEALLDSEGIAATIKKVKDAATACLMTQPTPFDATFVLRNPGFEEGSNSINGVTTPVSWDMDYILGTSGRDIKLSTAIPAEGEYKYNIWATSVTHINLYQDVNLPGGEYTLTAAIRTDNETNISDQHLYARAGNDSILSPTLIYTEDPYWQELSLDFKVPGGGATVRIGASSTGTGTAAGWFQVDNFQLTCNSSIVAITAPSYNNQQFSVTGVKGGIVLKSEADHTPIRIHALTGQLLKSLTVSQGETFVAFPQGIYIVSGKKVVVQ